MMVAIAAVAVGRGAVAPVTGTAPVIVAPATV